MEWQQIRSLTEERAIQDATPAHIDLDAFRSYLQRLGFDTTEDPQPDGEADLRNRDVVVEIGGEFPAQRSTAFWHSEEIPNVIPRPATFASSALLMQMTTVLPTYCRLPVPPVASMIKSHEPSGGFWVSAASRHTGI